MHRELAERRRSLVSIRLVSTSSTQAAPPFDTPAATQDELHTLGLSSGAYRNLLDRRSLWCYTPELCNLHVLEITKQELSKCLEWSR
jgi:hypothetical protein